MFARSWWTEAAVLALAGSLAASAALARGPAHAKPPKKPTAEVKRAPAVPEPVVSPAPGEDLTALLAPEGNGTVFHKDGVDDRVAQASRLQPKIDAWAEGSVISLEEGKLVLYGHRLPYATLYARMMRDVAVRTKGLHGAPLTERVLAVQKEWQKRNFKSEELSTPDTESETAFDLARSGRLALLDEAAGLAAKLAGPLHLPASATTVVGSPMLDGAGKKGSDAEEPPNDNARQARDAAAIVSSNAGEDEETLHIGDKVRLGYDSTTRPPMAFVAYRVARPSSVIAVDQ